MARIPGYVYLAAMGGVALVGYYLYKKKEFPFNEGSILNELKNDLSNLEPGRGGNSGGGSPSQGGQAPVGDLSNDMIPGTVQSNPSAVDYGLYQNYLQGLKQAFPDYTPNLAQGQGGQQPVIAGDPNLFQNNPLPGGPPVQPYPGGALMPPYTQQMYPYYRAPMIPERGSMRGGPIGPPPYFGPRPRPYGPPPWDDPWFEYDYDKYGRRRRKWNKPKPTADPDKECMIRMGPICIGRNGINVGDLASIGTGGINVGSGGSSSSNNNNVSGGGINVGGLFQGNNLKDMFGNLSPNRSQNTNPYGIGTSANSGVIKGQVNNMLNDIFAQSGISR